MTIQIDLTDVLAKVVATVIIAAITGLTPMALLWLHAKTAEIRQRVGAAKFDQLQAIAEKAVKIAEQAGLIAWAQSQIKLLGSQKKAIALDAAQAYADNIGLKINIHQLDTAIESQVVEQFPHLPAPQIAATTSESAPKI